MRFSELCNDDYYRLGRGDNACSLPSRWPSGKAPAEDLGSVPSFAVDLFFFPGRAIPVT